MQVVVEIPDDMARDRTAADWSRHLLELMVADAYDRGKASAAEVRRILQLPNRLAVVSDISAICYLLLVERAALRKHSP